MGTNGSCVGSEVRERQLERGTVRNRERLCLLLCTPGTLKVSADLR